MADNISPEKRSALMASVRSKNTKPEWAVRRVLHASGWRYRLHRKGLPGTPDLVFVSLKAALFVHGCFWHGHSCPLGRLPKTRTNFWMAKIAANRERDARKVAELTGNGWRVMTVWQCSLKQPDRLLVEMEEFLRGDETLAETRFIEVEKGV